MAETQTVESPATSTTPQRFTHLVEGGESRRPGAQVKTWCGNYIRNGSNDESARGAQPTCPVCRQLQADLDEMEF